MATLTDQMRNLAADILNGHEERKVWLGTLRQEVKATLEESAVEREKAAATARKERKTCFGGLRKEVKGMRKEFRTDQQEGRLAWQEMANIMEARRIGGRIAATHARPAKPVARPKSAARRGK